LEELAILTVPCPRCGAKSNLYSTARVERLIRHDSSAEIADRLAAVNLQVPAARYLEPAWVEAKLERHGGVQGGDILRVFDRAQAEFFADSMSRRALDVATRKLDGEAMRVIIASTRAGALIRIVRRDGCGYDLLRAGAAWTESNRRMKA
jgi:hypothetical protein